MYCLHIINANIWDFFFFFLNNFLGHVIYVSSKNILKKKVDSIPFSKEFFIFFI